jgi:Tfp pilus assembly protein PilO
MMNWNELYRAITFSFRHSRVRLGGYLFLIVLLVALTIVLTVWLPVYNEYSAAWEQNVKSQAEIRKVSQRNKLAVAYQINMKRISNVEKKLAVRNGQAEIINGISNLAERNNISIVSESYNEGERVSGYDLLNQNLVLEGSYSSIRQFLRELDQLAVWTVPQEIRLKSLNDNKKGIRASLKLTIYTKSGFN